MTRGKDTTLRMVAFCVIALTPLAVSFADPKNDSIAVGWSEDFTNSKGKGGVKTPDEWVLKEKLGTAAATFTVTENDGKTVLSMTADKASGTLLRQIQNVDLKKFPVLRWRWRVLAFPKGGDGRDSAKDDQAIGVYVGTGKWFQDSVAYRWETVTPVGAEGEVKYGGGMVKVKWYCLRNENNGVGTWFEESRNVAADFKKAYGYVPDSFAVSVVCNSQYTGTMAKAELEWMKFTLPEKNDKP